MISAFYGDTIQTKCMFQDYEGNGIDPSNIVVKIYKYKQYTLIDSITDVVREDFGRYHALYTLPEGEGREIFIVEWAGIYEGKPTITRQQLSVRFS